jgi:predicted nucleic acid-binding protein
VGRSASEARDGTPNVASSPAPLMKALFDTNILIDYLNGVEASETELNRYRERLISVVTWMELLIGGRDDEETSVIELFLRDFRVIEISRSIAREAVDIRRAHRIRLPDAIVWASARSESALLVTRNTKDLSRDEPGIRVPY